MRDDTIDLNVAVCGSLPKLTKWLSRSKGIGCCVFKDGWELRDRLKDIQAEPIDIALVESNCGFGLHPLYFSATRDDCPVLMVPDTSRDFVSMELDELRRKKRQQQERELAEIREQKALMVAIRQDAEVTEKDGIPGLRLGEKERYAGDPVQTWILRLLADGERSLDDIEAQMVAELMPEVERRYAELWQDWQEDGEPPIVEQMKQWFSKEGFAPDNTLAGVLTMAFVQDFTDFLERQGV